MIFSKGRPQMLAESPGDNRAPDRLCQDYLHDLYLLASFYIAHLETSLKILDA